MPQRPAKPTILLTGFGPFLTVAENVTGTLVPALAKAVIAHFPHVTCVAEILPTDWQQAPLRLDELMRAHNPAIVLQFGVSPRAKGFVIETRARNARQASVDVSGCKPDAARVAAGGPKFIATTVPVKTVLTRLHALGLRATKSHSAGEYLCNALLYHGLWASTCAGPTNPPPIMGFVHLPVELPTTAPAPKTLTMDQAINGSVAIVAACHDALSGNSV
jgi:pyroglutamyl-peptidase